jgi:hypothetical protein
MRTRRFARAARACLAIALALAIQVATTLVAIGASGGSDWLRRPVVN